MEELTRCVRCKMFVDDGRELCIFCQRDRDRAGREVMDYSKGRPHADMTIHQRQRHYGIGDKP